MEVSVQYMRSSQYGLDIYVGRKRIVRSSDEQRKVLADRQRKYRNLHPLTLAEKQRKAERTKILQRTEKYKALAAARYRLKKEARSLRDRPSSCECCGKSPPPGGGKSSTINWDHCHTTGKFRGWLCTGCNTALGMANDDPRILRSLADYIERWQESYKEPGASLIQPSFL